MADNVLKSVEGEGRPRSGETTSASEMSPMEFSGDWRPFEALRREIDRLFQDIETGKPLVRTPFGKNIFDFEPFSRSDASWGAIPAVDVIEKDTHFEISAELPGVEAKDIEVNVTSDTLRIKGEKKEEKEEEKKDYHLSERRYGAFQRTFRFPEYVDPDKIEASFKEGVLTIILPKSEEAQPPGKCIPIKTK